MRKAYLSSFFKPNTDLINQFPEKERWDILKEIEVSTDTLDHVLKEAGYLENDALKLDTQGSGKIILEGAKETLKSTFAIEIELEFSPLYQNQDLFADVDPLLRESGFQLFDLRPWYWKREVGKHLGMQKGQLMFADALYLKEEKEILSRIKKSAGKGAGKAKALKALALCIHFGYIDYALKVYQGVKPLFTPTEKKAY